MSDIEQEEFKGIKTKCCGVEPMRDDDYPDYICCSECGAEVGYE